MGKKDRRVDAYIAGAADFAKPILTHLRKLVHTGCPEAEEAIKWQFPSFMYKGILCGMAAFKNHCTFGFWKGELMFPKSKEGAAREESAMGHFGRITALSELPKEDVLLRYIKEAVRLNNEGIKPPSRTRPKEHKPLRVPDSLKAALKKNKQALTSFDNFSYSHKREYVEWITEAKTDETRQRRLETTIAWLAQGKPRNWKYMNC